MAGKKVSASSPQALRTPCIRLLSSALASDHLSRTTYARPVRPWHGAENRMLVSCKCRGDVNPGERHSLHTLRAGTGWPLFQQSTFRLLH